MEMKRSSLMGLPILSATMAISMAAVLGSTSWSFSLPAEPGAGSALTTGAAAGIKELIKTVDKLIIKKT